MSLEARVDRLRQAQLSSLKELSTRQLMSPKVPSSLSTTSSLLVDCENQSPVKKNVEFYFIDSPPRTPLTKMPAASSSVPSLLLENEALRSMLSTEKARMRASYQKRIIDLQDKHQQEIALKDAEIKSAQNATLVEREKLRKFDKIAEECKQGRLRIKDYEKAIEASKTRCLKAEQSLFDKTTHFNEAMKIIDSLDARCKELTEENAKLVSLSERQLKALKSFE